MKMKLDELSLKTLRAMLKSAEEAAGPDSISVRIINRTIEAKLLKKRSPTRKTLPFDFFTNDEIQTAREERS